MIAKLKILSCLLVLILFGCATPEEKQARQAEKDKLEEQRRAEEEKKAEQMALKFYEKYGTPDRALMTLGVPTNRTEGDEVLILEYQWSGCACNAILSYDKNTKELINPNITPCQVHGWTKFGFPEFD